MAGMAQRSLQTFNPTIGVEPDVTREYLLCARQRGTVNRDFGLSSGQTGVVAVFPPFSSVHAVGRFGRQLVGTTEHNLCRRVPGGMVSGGTMMVIEQPAAERF